MAERKAFSYGPDCSGPAVSIGDIPFLPICSMPTYISPTLALHHVDMTLPDLAPPPLCPCIWTFKAEAFSIRFTQIQRISAVGSLYVVPAPPTIDRNCCEPSFEISAWLRLPCMPFSVIASPSINIGTFSFHVSQVSCKVKLHPDISLPATWISMVQSVSFVSNQFRYHSKRLRVYAVQDGTDTTWATAEPCP